MKTKSKRLLIVISRELSLKMEVHNVLYIEQHLRDVHIFTKEGMVSYRGRLEEVLGRLGPMFVPCHSYLGINFERVERMAQETIVFDTGQEMRIGRNSYYQLRRRFNDYLRTLQ